MAKFDHAAYYDRYIAGPDIDDETPTEADESAASKQTALDNLAEQVRKDESRGIIDMYERGAWNAGASVAETEAILRQHGR